MVGGVLDDDDVGWAGAELGARRGQSRVPGIEAELGRLHDVVSDMPSITQPDNTVTLSAVPRLIVMVVFGSVMLGMVMGMVSPLGRWRLALMGP